MSTNKSIEDFPYYKLNTLRKLQSKGIHNRDIVQMTRVLLRVTIVNFNPQGLIINKVAGRNRPYARLEWIRSWHLARTEKSNFHQLERG